MHDVVVVGAGPGGSAVSHYLARQGMNVLLLDRARFPRDKTCGDALTPRALELLRDMDMLSQIRRVGRSVRDIRVSAPNGHSFGEFSAASDEAPHEMLIVPRKTLDEELCHRAVASGVEFRDGVNVVDLLTGDDGLTVTGQGRAGLTRVRARLGVLATGASVGLLSRIGALRCPPLFAVAARAYFEGVDWAHWRPEIRFGGVPLPGYGWVFPISDRIANVGAGYVPSGRVGERARRPIRSIFQDFLSIPTVRDFLASSRQIEPTRSYPIRIDFPTGPTSDNRLLFVGEAAGLANPLTAEGIGFALESGRIAAAHIGAMFAKGDFSRAGLARYDRYLRERFAALFESCARIRRLCFNTPGLNGIAWLAARHRLFRRRILDLILDVGRSDPFLAAQSAGWVGSGVL